MKCASADEIFYYLNLLISIEQNILLMDEIESKETHTLDHVKGLLRRYEKYRV